jgi:uncharacterized protein HemX
MKAPSGRGTFIQRSRSVSPEQKALYHQVLGAGKSRVKREFFDISQADLMALAARLQQLMGDKIRAIAR